MRGGELADKNAEIADLTAKLAAVSDADQRAQTVDSGHYLPESDAEKRAKANALWSLCSVT